MGYWSQVVSSKVHSAGNQQNLVPDFRYEILALCTCLNENYQAKGRKASSQQWMGKAALGPQGWFFIKDVEWDQSVYMMIDPWAPRKAGLDHQEKQAMGHHARRTVKRGKGGAVMREWPKEPGEIWVPLSLLSHSGTGCTFHTSMFLLGLD